MTLNLAVLAEGVACPGGGRLAALLQDTPWKAQSVPSPQDPDLNWPALLIDRPLDPIWRRWQAHPRLRRASGLSLYMAEATSQALEGLPPGVRKERVGLIGVLGSATIVFTRRFFQTILDRGAALASPVAFPEAGFNAPLSHVAAVHQLVGPSYTLVGDDSCWATALLTASIWLRLGKCDTVMVVAGEEIDFLSLEAYHTAGWLSTRRKFLPAEGAAAVLLRLPQTGDYRIIQEAADGFAYHQPRDARQQALRCLSLFPTILPVYPTATHSWLAPIETELLAGRTLLTPVGAYCGEAGATSAAWRMLRALSLIHENQPELLLPIFGLTQQIAALRLGRSSI